MEKSIVMRETIRKKDAILVLTTICALLALMISIALREKLRSLDGGVIATFAANGCVWFFLFAKELRKKPYSLVMLQWFFCLSFFFLAPVAQYFTNWFPWIAVRSDEILIRTNIVLFIWTISVLLGETLAKKRFKSSSNGIKKCLFPKIFSRADIMSENGDRLESLLPVLSCINIIVMVVFVRQVGFMDLLSRSTRTDVRFSSAGTVSMMIGGMLQAACYFSVVISVNRFLKDNRKFIFLLINAAALLVTYFPAGLARYAIAVLYLGTMLTLFRSWRDNRFFILLFTMSFLIVLPFFSAFRFGTMEAFDFFKTAYDVVFHISDNLVEPDYDAYTQISLTLEYVDTYGFGKNHILTVIFFFVPRAVWPGKSFAGGADVAHTRGLFDNVSFPFPALSYIDMGFLGVILVGIFVGYAMKKMDALFWDRIDKSGKAVRAYDYLYHVFLTFFLFLCRGDAFYVWSYMTCYIITWYMIVKASSIRLFRNDRYMARW